jgi:adenylate kinase family enzyme
MSDEASVERVLIIGSPGSGKSALAQRIGAATGLPVVHLDSHYWGAGWTEPSREEWRTRLTELMAGPRWILDGNYTGTLPLRLARADTAILLECPRWLCLARVLRRALLSHGRRRGADMAAGCPERFDWAFVVYVWRFGSDNLARVRAALQEFSGRVVILRGRRDAAAFLAEFCR